MLLDKKAPSRIQRSLLSVPATAPRLFEKAAKGEADAVFIDLEDSVPPGEKVRARNQAISALKDIDWGVKAVGIRINALDTEWGLRDILDIASQCSRLNFVLIPRVESDFDLLHVDALLGSLEREAHRAERIAIQALIETPLGLTRVETIAGSTRRLEAISFGFGDFSIGMGTYDSVIGPGGEPWTYAIARIATACKAYGLRAIDGPYTHYHDREGLERRAKLAAQLGFDGKWVIHPSQIPTCHAVFSPSQEHLDWALNTLRMVRQSIATGSGATGHNGSLLDMAHVRLAEDILNRSGTSVEEN